jgi:hypothetical protein
MLFPDNVLPEQVMEVARMAVKCKYAIDGTYGAALLRGNGAWRLVIEPIEDMEGAMSVCVAALAKSGDEEIQNYPLDAISVEAAQRRQLETLDEMITKICQ